MEKSVEKSQEQADIIIAISGLVLQLDTAYCRSLAKDMKAQASRQETIAALNPIHPQTKNHLLRKQGEALLHLTDYVETLKHIDEIKLKLQREEFNRVAINNLFI